MSLDITKKIASVTLDGQNWEVGSGSELPSVTSEDNGDVLQVVNGVWAKAETDSTPTSGSTNLVTSGGVYNELDYKQDAPTRSSQTAPTSITISNNTDYTLTDVSSLTFSFPSTSNYAAWIRMTTASSGTITITFPNSTKYVPSVPTFGNGETWLLFIENGIVIAQKAVSA